jgi:hypothetical protein
MQLPSRPIARRMNRAVLVMILGLMRMLRMILYWEVSWRGRWFKLICFVMVVVSSWVGRRA